MSFINQLPRLSAYDPGATGEGGLDPLGLAAVAERIAEVLVPGVRARMSLPRFVTASAVGAIAGQSLRELKTDDGKTTVDIAFEWIVVEAIVRNPGQGRKEGLPGSQKAERAKIANERLSRRTYLNGPRVFGFTGVYRPLSRDLDVLTMDDLPAKNAFQLLNAWEIDHELHGFVDGDFRTTGGTFRKQLIDACRSTLEKGECAVVLNSKLFRRLAELLSPREARQNERRMLRELIKAGRSDIRNELTAGLIAKPPSKEINQRDLAYQLLPRMSVLTKRALQAAIDFENAATAIDNAFRCFIYFTSQHGWICKPGDVLQIPRLAELAPKIEGLVKRAEDSVNEIGDGSLSDAVDRCFRRFGSAHTASSLFEAVIERHEEVQSKKKKLSWVDRFKDDWTVRTPYRSQETPPGEEVWTHPMRIVTLANLLRETA